MKFRKTWEISKQQPREEKITQEWRKADFFLNSVSLKRRMIFQTGLLLRTGGTLEVIYCKPLSLEWGDEGWGGKGFAWGNKKFPQTWDRSLPSPHTLMLLHKLFWPGIPNTGLYSLLHCLCISKNPTYRFQNYSEFRRKKDQHCLKNSLKHKFFQCFYLGASNN